MNAWAAGSVVDTDVEHAVRPTISGYRAWCGAGNIDQFLLERFEHDRERACRVCSDLLRVTVPEQRATAFRAPAEIR